MVCYFKCTVIAGLSMDGCFDISRVDDEQWDFRRFFNGCRY